MTPELASVSDRCTEQWPLVQDALQMQFLGAAERRVLTVLCSLFLPGGRDCLPPAASLQRRRLARRPGYMRSTAGPRIGFLYPAAATVLRAHGGACGEESHQSESRAGRGGLDPGGQWRGPSVGSPVPRSTAASARTPVGYGGLARTPARRPSGLFGIQFQVGTTLPARPARSCGPGDAGWQGELPSMDSSEAPGAGWDAGGGERAKDTWTKGCLFPEEVNGDSCGLGSDPRVPSAPGSSQDTFTSSFSFIRLSLGSAGERGEAEGCPPSREAEAPCQSPKDTEAKAAGLDRPHEHPRLLSPHFYLKTPQRLADSAQTAGGSHRLERETPTLLDVDTASCFSPGPSGSEGSSLGDAPRWETLVRRCEPVLLDCLLSDQRRLEVGVPTSGAHDYHGLRSASGRGQETSLGRATDFPLEVAAAPFVAAAKTWPCASVSSRAG